MLKEGTVIDDKYEILKQIGEGGMSTVYLARNNRMNMQLAVKEIKNDGSKSTEILLKGLEREANILKDVDHPVIPRIIDIVKYGETICVVMDFIEGENLADKLNADLLLISVPVQHRLIMNCGYTGYAGGLRVIENIYDRVLATYR